MKAAILFQGDSIPRCVDIPEADTRQQNELLLTMKAAAIKHIDKSRATGRHYSAKRDIATAKIIGGDGVGVMEDGTRVYAIGNGMIAEKATVEKDRIVPLPPGIDDAIAAALPNAVIGSAMGLLFKAEIQKGETVLINGATGFTGRIAVQIAKYYGAGKIIVTGRNEQSLQSLVSLGADEIILLNQGDESFVMQIKKQHALMPIDIVIDYLWGHTAELILSSFKGKGSFTHHTRFVSIGAVTGDTIQLSAELLRSVDIQLSGSGLGSWNKKQVQQLFTHILPEMFQLAADKKLQVGTFQIPIADIENAWSLPEIDGKRLVVVI